MPKDGAATILYKSSAVLMQAANDASTANTMARCGRHRSTNPSIGLIARILLPHFSLPAQKMLGTQSIHSLGATSARLAKPTAVGPGSDAWS